MAAIGSGRRPQMAADPPAPTIARAVAAPIPVPPPVTIANRPSSASAASGERNPSTMSRVCKKDG